MLYEVHRLACFANEYENDFIKAMVGRSAKVAENDRVRKKRELDGLLARDKELDMPVHTLKRNIVAYWLSIGPENQVRQRNTLKTCLR